MVFQRCDTILLFRIINILDHLFSLLRFKSQRHCIDALLSTAATVVADRTNH